MEQWVDAKSLYVNPNCKAEVKTDNMNVGYSAISPAHGMPSRLEVGVTPRLRTEPIRDEMNHTDPGMTMSQVFAPPQLVPSENRGQQIPPFPGPFNMPMAIPLPPPPALGLPAPFNTMQGSGLKPSLWSMSPQMPEALGGNPTLQDVPNGKQLNSTKTIVVPPPNPRVPSYVVPLPNDCEGLIFALEGKYRMGDEIVSDAAFAILSVLSEKYDKVAAAPLEILARPKLKLQIVKSLENSWITSSLLGSRLLSVAGQMKSQVDRILGKSDVDASVTGSDLEKLKDFPYLVEAFVSVTEALEKWVGIRHCLGVLEKSKPVKNEPKPQQRTQSKRELLINPNPEPRGVGRPRSRRVPSIGEFVDSLESSMLIPIPKPPPRYDVIGSIAQFLPPLANLWRHTMVCAEVEIHSQFKAEEKVSDSESVSAHSTKHIPETQTMTDAFGDSVFHSDLESELRKASSLFADPELVDLFLESVKEVEFLQWKEHRRHAQSDTASSNSPVEDRAPDAQEPNCVSGFNRHNLEVLLHGEQQERSKQIARLEKELLWSFRTDIGLKYPFVVSANRIMVAVLKLAGYLGPVGYRELIAFLINNTTQTWQDLCCINTREENVINCPQVFKQIGTSYLESLLHFAWEQGVVVSQPAKDPSFLAMSFRMAIFTIRSFATFVTLSLFPSVATRTAKTFQHISQMAKDDSVPVDLPLFRAALLVILVGLDEVNSINELEQLAGIGLHSFVMALLYCTFGASVVYGRIKGHVSDVDAVHLTERREELLSDSQALRLLVGNLTASLQEKVIALMKEKRPLLDASIQNSDAHDLGASARQSVLGGGAGGRRLSTDRTNYKITPGSYTHPLSQAPSEWDIIDSTKERSTSYGADMYGPIFEDIIYTCSATLAHVSHDPESRALLKGASTILEEIAVLSRSTQIAQLCRCIAQDEPVNGFCESNMEEGYVSAE
eukprot:Gregarina_sp_Poly_1__10251@NODE_714_length_6642_cov_66_231939_g539_i0_p1_GENE_NODE_714_length_6642_cov_66_231939_g539_i0NODE_714_length_6642_cov_66_231939_g539_i0_p1_ORF_typecomplete_len949_score150_84_NODE_714_length_6642_cov_66_231939_g539_i03933239